MAETGVASLPIELLELIIGLITSRATLQSCALVNSTFLYVAQQSLFAEVTLSPPKRRGVKLVKTTPAQRLLETIRTSNHLATFVSTLTIECEDSQQEEPWLYDDTALQHILPRLVNLSRISVNGKVAAAEDETTPSKANLSWSSMSATLRSALTSAMQSGSVVDLELGGFSRIPVSSVIQSCSQLKKLSLLPLYLVEEEVKGAEEAATLLVSGPPTPSSSTLEDITIKQSSAALRRTSEWLIRSDYGLNIHQLKKIHFTVANNEDHRYIADILERCTGSLNELELNPGSDIFFVRHLLRSSSPIAPRSSPLTLQGLASLRSLKINTEMRMYKLNNNRYSDPLPWIVSLLTTLPPDNEFASLELSLGMYVNKQILESISWMKLVNTLTSDRFPHFKRLILSFAMSKKESEDGSVSMPSWVREVLQTNGQLSQLAKEGSLVVNL